MGSWKGKVTEDLQNNGYAISKIEITGEVETLDLPGEHKGRPITSIDSFLLRECPEAQGIKKIVLSEGLLEIGVGAFSDLKNLEEVVLPNSLESISHNAFEGCERLKRIKMGDNLKGIGEHAFKDCYELEEIVFSPVLELIGAYAFSGCRKLKEIEIPSSVEEIRQSVFSGCSNLKSITLPFVGKKRDGEGRGGLSHIFGLYCVPPGLKHVTISEATVLQENAFNGCEHIESIELPRGFKSGEGAFYGCDSLKRVYFDGDIEDWCRMDFSRNYSNPLSNGAELYLKGALLKKATIPPIERINDDAFYGCVSIEDVEIPNTVKSIGNGAFSGCKGLKSIEIPKSVTEIGYGAFSYCNNLENVKILGRVKRIACLNECISIKSIVLPSGAEAIGEGAFHGCTSLERVEIPATVKEVHYSAFYDCPNVTLYCKAKKACCMGTMEG